MFFFHIIVLISILFSNTRKLALPCILFPSARFGRDTNISNSSGSTMVKILLSTGIATCSYFFICQAELITPIRHCRIDTDLIHRMNCLKQELRIHKISSEVYGIFTSFLLEDSTIQCTGTFEDRMTSFFESLYHFVGCMFSHRENRHTISLFRPWTPKCPMSW